MSAKATPQGRTDNTTDLPHPRDDPDLKYAHEGKQYTVFESGFTFTVVEYKPDAGPTKKGLVIVEHDEGEEMMGEHKHSKGGVGRRGVAEHIPDDSTRAVWSVEGILSAMRRMEIGEVDPMSYDDLYWDAQE